ncbi:ComEC/Rec2 family competence protein [Pannus brasiliensis CCIBt3594]|uniref:ComEC/Rec2 family competence protein n=1 Tax=Pannus brasiliensis CCIBt3594 TaxID=1427578 RepID=A0AAW9QSJ8_9CHRO
MNRYSGTIVCLAYSIGLLSTGILDFSDGFPVWWEWLIRISGLTFLALLLAIFAPRFWWLSPPRKIWFIAGLVAILASIYLEFRVPYPTANDISQIAEKGGQIITVAGNSISETRLNRKGNLQFQLQVKQFSANDLPSEHASGKLYVTLPNTAENRLYSGQEVTVKGLLYRPRRANNPGAFDFRDYLARQGIFAGLQGRKIIEKKPPSIGVWQIRQRIIDAQIQGLGKEKGSLLSSITLGRQSIDLPANIQDKFTKTGLAHVLAVSGFHVALLLGILLTVTRRLSARSQFIIGSIFLLFYLTLTGFQPSVARAVLMGLGALIGILYNRKINSFGSLLVAGTILLIFQPLWIWNLGFQLSFLGTLGLLITLPAIQNRIDYLPVKIAEPIGITLAATIWTLPLLMYTFSSIAPYSLLVNVITTPLVMIVSLGGVISAFLALLYPPLGSASAWLLYYPIELLLQILTFFTCLPMSTYATGKLSLGAMLILYALLGLLCVNQWLQKRWYFVALFAFIIILLPILYNALTLTKVTVFATRKEAAIVIQNRGRTVLINGNDPDTARYTILPFLREQGVNQIQGAIAVLSKPNWSSITENLPIDREMNLSREKKATLGSIEFQTDRDFLQFQIDGKRWRWILTPDKTVSESPSSPVFVLLWKGRSIEENWLETLQPRAAIAITSNLSRTTRKQLKNAGIDYFWTGRDGAIQWTPKEGFQPFLEESRPFN